MFNSYINYQYKYAFAVIHIFIIQNRLASSNAMAYALHIL